MRKTADLVNEMLSEAKTALIVAIVVGFEQETKFVFSTQKQPLRDLNDLIQKGGSPIGLLRFDREASGYRDPIALSRSMRVRNG